MRKTTALATLLLAATVAFPGTAQQKTFTVGIPLPLTGAEAKFGEMKKVAYEMAAEEINAKAGPKGVKLAFDIQDSGAKQDTSAAIVEKFITVNKYPMIAGEYSSACSNVAAATAEKYKTPYLVDTGAADKITQQGYKYVFRLNTPSSQYAKAVQNFFEVVAKPKSIAVLYENTDFGTSTSKAIKEYSESHKIEVVLYEGYQQGAIDFKPILQKVKSLRPDIVYMVSYLMDASLLMRQSKELDINPQAFIGGAAGHTLPELLENAGDASEYCMSATLWTPQVKYPGAKEFFDKYSARAKKSPSYHAAEAYATAYVIADVLKRTKSWAADDLRDALAATDMMTVFGPVKFISWDKYTNQNKMETLVGQWLKKKFETVWPENLASAKAVYPAPRWRERK